MTMGLCLLQLGAFIWEQACHQAWRTIVTADMAHNSEC
jgi:hypothetical protein